MYIQQPSRCLGDSSTACRTRGPKVSIRSIAWRSSFFPRMTRTVNAPCSGYISHRGRPPTRYCRFHPDRLPPELNTGTISYVSARNRLSHVLPDPGDPILIRRLGGSIHHSLIHGILLLLHTRKVEGQKKHLSALRDGENPWLGITKEGKQKR